MDHQMIRLQFYTDVLNFIDYAKQGSGLDVDKFCADVIGRLCEVARNPDMEVLDTNIAKLKEVITRSVNG
jgi:hypothetical protein